jgi:hypothetical protein
LTWIPREPEVLVQVLGPDRVRVQVDATEVGDPGEARRVVDDDLVGGPSRGKGQGRGPDELGQVLRRSLLEERLARSAVHEALEGHRPPAGAAQRAIGHGEVVVDEVELGVAGLGEIDLGRVRDGDLAVADPEQCLLRCHGRHDTLDSRRRATHDAPHDQRDAVMDAPSGAMPHAGVDSVLGRSS